MGDKLFKCIPEILKDPEIANHKPLLPQNLCKLVHISANRDDRIMICPSHIIIEFINQMTIEGE